MSLFSRYGEVLRPPGARTALLASLAARLSIAMNGLALLLIVRQSTGSYGGAGLVSAAYTVALAVAAPVRARAADRRGPTPVLRSCAAVHPLAFVAVVALVSAHASVFLVAVAAAAVGVTVPPVGGVVRALWGQLLAPAAQPVAYSLDAVLVELCFVTGPLLVAVIAGLATPALALVVSAVAASGGAFVLAGVPVVRGIARHERQASHPLGPLVSPVVRACLLCVLFIGVSFGAIEVGVLAFVEGHGRPRSVAGAVLAVWSLGSALGGLLYAALHVGTSPRRQLPALAVVTGAAASLPLFAPGVLSLGGLLLLAGTTIAPWNGVNSVVVGQAAPEGTTTEAFAWLSTLIFAGASAGTAASGLLADAHGATGAFGVASAAGVLAALSALISL